MSISRFDDLEGRIYHEVLLDHQREDDDGSCLCGWKVYVKGIYTHRMHLAIVIKDWMEANFIIIDKT